MRIMRIMRIIKNMIENSVEIKDKSVNNMIKIMDIIDSDNRNICNNKVDVIHNLNYNRIK